MANVILLKMAGRLEGFALLPIWSIKCLAGYLSVLEETKGSHYDILKEILERGNRQFLDLCLIFFLRHLIDRLQIRFKC